MVFSTTIFLFLFLPVFLAGYYLLPFRVRSAWILLGSWVFYGWWRLDFLALLILTSIWNYVLGRSACASRRTGERGRRRSRAALMLGITLNIGSLGYFKYYNFSIDSLNTVLTSIGAEALQTWSVILPIGISFYIFQATSYLIDVYRGDAPAARSFVDMAAYIALFPQLIAGPILRYKDLADQFAGRTHSFQLFSQGSYRFMAGFAKKVLIADTVAVIADTAFALEAPGFIGAWLGTVAYTVQLYFDFSGYSDMAIGLGLMMGFRFMENFNYPYISRSITEFWRRWHISLSTWLRDYLYIPLGGNRRGSLKTYRNITLVMLLGGLWHGAAWNFAIWGLWHGLLLMGERLFGRSVPAGRLQTTGHRTGISADSGEPAAIGARLTSAGAAARTFLLVMLGWVVFRAPDLASAARMYAGMTGLQGVGQYRLLMTEIGMLSVSMLLISLCIMFSASQWAFNIQQRRHRKGYEYIRLTIIPLFILSILKLMAESYSPFLYFQF